MDATYQLKQDNEEYSAGVGNSLTLAVNELPDVLHTFYPNVVQED